MERHYQNYVINTDKKSLSIEMIHDFFVTKSYWAKKRTLEQVKKSIENSICFGVFFEEKQVGFARVVTDYSTFYYICDVFILNEYRIPGLGKFLIQCIIESPEIKDLRGILITRDEHGLYETFGFKKASEQDKLMIKEIQNS